MDIGEIKINRREFIGASILTILAADKINEKLAPKKEFNWIDFILDNVIYMDPMEKVIFYGLKIHRKLGLYQRVAWVFESIKKRISK